MPTPWEGLKSPQQIVMISIHLASILDDCPESEVWIWITLHFENHYTSKCLKWNAYEDVALVNFTMHNLTQVFYLYAQFYSFQSIKSPKVTQSLRLVNVKFSSPFCMNKVGNLWLSYAIFTIHSCILKPWWSAGRMRLLSHAPKQTAPF